MRAQPLARQAFAEALDDLLDDRVFELAGGEVVEEEERVSALHGDVVDAVVDEVLADGVVDAELEGDLELGADAVGAGDEDGVGELLEVEREEAAEAADLAEDLAVEGLAGEHLDALLAAIGAGDVDAGVGVGDGLFCRPLQRRLALPADFLRLAAMPCCCGFWGTVAPVAVRSGVGSVSSGKVRSIGFVENEEFLV